MRRKATILSFVLLLAVLFSGCTGEQNPLPQPGRTAGARNIDDGASSRRYEFIRLGSVGMEFLGD